MPRWPRTGVDARAARAAVLALPLAVLLGASTCSLPWTAYVLEPGSLVEEGCFDPCACPSLLPRELRGVLLLQPVAGDPGDPFRSFRVGWLLWFYGDGDARTLVTGKGSYRVGGEFGLQQQLSLDLRVGAEPVQHYDSGLVAGGSDADPLPPLRIEISRNGRFCYDRVFTIVATPRSHR